MQYYNLDVIISVGYRVKSKRGTQFRQYIEIWRLFYFFLLYLKKVKVFHNFSCVFEKNAVPLQRILIEGIQCREKSYIVEF